jgi:hypothetical protein
MGWKLHEEFSLHTVRWSTLNLSVYKDELVSLCFEIGKGRTQLALKDT